MSCGGKSPDMGERVKIPPLPKLLHFGSFLYRQLCQATKGLKSHSLAEKVSSCVCVYVCMGICVYRCVYVCMVCVCVICVYVGVCVYVCLCICMGICVFWC